MNQTETINKVLKRIEGKETIGVSNNDIDMREMANDPTTPTYAPTDYPADGHPSGASEINHMPESKKHTASHSIDQEKYKKDKCE